MSHTSQFQDRVSCLLSIIRSAETDNAKIALCASLDVFLHRVENKQLKKRLALLSDIIETLKELITDMSQNERKYIDLILDLRKEINSIQMAQLQDCPRRPFLRSFPRWALYGAVVAVSTALMMGLKMSLS